MTAASFAGPVWQRRAVLAALAGACASAWSQPASGGRPIPAVLRSPALRSARAASASMLGITLAGRRLVTVGERGIVLVSDDQGAHWQQAEVPVQVTLTAVRFADDRHGWAVGHLGVILATRDGGMHWTLQLQGVQAVALVQQASLAAGDESWQREAEGLVADGPDKPFLDIEVLDARRAIAVGAYGLVFTTDDGGEHWLPAQGRFDQRPGLHFYGARRVGSRLYLAGEQGLLNRSSDEGRSFVTVPTPYKGSYFGLVDTHQDGVLLFGLRGSILRSERDDAAWVRVDSPVQTSLSAGLSWRDGTVLLASQGGDLLLSRDHGRSFARQPGQFPPNVAALATSEQRTLWLASLRGVTSARWPMQSS